MRPPDLERPPTEVGGASKTTGPDRDTSLSPVNDSPALAVYDVYDAAFGARAVDLIRELRPDIAIPVIRSLACELIDVARADAAWLQRRQSLDKHVEAAAHNKHVGRSYQLRRAQELEDAKPRAGDRAGVTT